jgi:hypothetical protein
MNGKHIINLAGATLLAGGLFAGGVGWTAAQDQPAGGDEHGHGRGTPAVASQTEVTDDALSSMVRDIMEEMMPGMMTEMMPDMMAEIMPGMMDDMMAFMMDDMMAHMMAGDMMGGGMRGDGMQGGMVRDKDADRGEHRAIGGPTDDQRARMQTVVAEALGLTVEELEGELADGKSVRVIAEEQGVDIADLHETVMDEFANYDR